jgi:hypothetical protein
MAEAPRATAQIIAIGPPSFQSNDFPSLETTILDRLALGGQPDSEDLATLSHLTVLESISMLADVQVDMRGSPLEPQLEGQIRQLWDAAAVFEESVSSVPLNAQNLLAVQPGFNNMQGAFREIESSVGGSAVLSNRAAAHLAGIARLTTATHTLMRAIESEVLPAGPVPPPRDLDGLGRQVRLLANGIVALIQNVKVSKHAASGWSAVTRDLEELFALVQSLQNSLVAQSSNNAIESALHAVRRRMWRAEARIARLGWPTDLDRQWRGVRERLNVISDQLGLPRVIDRAPQAQPNALSPPTPETAPPARIYRGPP